MLDGKSSPPSWNKHASVASISVTDLIDFLERIDFSPWIVGLGDNALRGAQEGVEGEVGRVGQAHEG